MVSNVMVCKGIVEQFIAAEISPAQASTVARMDLAIHPPPLVIPPQVGIAEVGVAGVGTSLLSPFLLPYAQPVQAPIAD